MKRLISYLKVRLHEEQMFKQYYIDKGLLGIAELHNENEKMLEESISILNGEIRESCGEFCTCQTPSIYVNTAGNPTCYNCGKSYVQNYQERT